MLQKGSCSGCHAWACGPHEGMLPRLPRYVMIVALIASAGGLLFGYDIGITGGVESMAPFNEKFFPGGRASRPQAAALPRRRPTVAGSCRQPPLPQGPSKPLPSSHACRWLCSSAGIEPSSSLLPCPLTARARPRFQPAEVAAAPPSTDPYCKYNDQKLQVGGCRMHARQGDLCCWTGGQSGVQSSVRLPLCCTHLAALLPRPSAAVQRVSGPCPSLPTPSTAAHGW